MSTLPTEIIKAIQTDTKPPEGLAFHVLLAIENDNRKKVEEAQRKAVLRIRFNVVRNYTICAGMAAAVTLFFCMVSFQKTLTGLDKKVSNLERQNQSLNSLMVANTAALDFRQELLTKARIAEGSSLTNGILPVLHTKAEIVPESTGAFAESSSQRTWAVGSRTSQIPTFSTSLK